MYGSGSPNLPPRDQLDSLRNKELSATVKELERLQAQGRDLDKELEALQGSGLQSARISDKEAVAKAAMAGKPLPERGEAEAEVEAVIARLTRQSAGLAEAVRLQRARLEELVERIRPKLTAELEKRVAEERRQVEDALDELERAEARVSISLGLSAWCRDFPSRGYKPIGQGYVFGLTGRNNDPTPKDRVRAAYRESIYPPLPKFAFPQMPRPEPQVVTR